ncbi:MAG: glycosyltransferase family 2 protein [Nitrosomonadales bacterium]|nr:glycosyltransferase family 2 protein [Nitrosomonadales bacterium]
MIDIDKVALCVPTLNAGATWVDWLDAWSGQLARPRTLAIDSGSTDTTAALAGAAGLRVCSIPRASFNHGGTRQQAVGMLDDAEIVVFLTQDAILAAPDSIRNLLAAFDDPAVGAACGRQLPHAHAGHIAAHARRFNYPETDAVRSAADIPALGIRTAYLSNSFAAYRKTALLSVGGFPRDVIFGEDMYVAARMLLSGWKLAYRADAAVRHSHDYGMRQEFRRYFDIGVMHAREPWLLQKLGKPEGEGMRFVRSETAWLWRHAPYLIPSAWLRTLLKLAGYRLGRIESRLPLWLKRRLGMLRSYWKE